MVRLREIPRTATFAWSPGSTQPLIATGTKAGAVDADFSNDTTLELWELNLDSAEQGIELHPVATVNVDSRFNGIAWSQPSESYPRGIIAGALDSGALVLWDAEKLQKGESDALIEQIDKHTGPIQAIQFNPFRPNILASAGAKGELYIHDIDDQSKTFRLGKAGANPDEYTSLDWNKKVAHILATGSSGGFVTVWDVKGKKENLTLNNFGRKTVSSVSWDPDVPTRLVTAIPADQNPLVLVWDLRNSNAPEKTLQAHDQGVLSLSWCVQDSDILLSAGKDNRTIAWNPHTGEYLGEFPVVTNWTFQTAFNPSNPNLLATASFDGKIAVQSLQNTGAGAEQTKSTAQALDGEDFFSKTHVEPQGASFSLKTPPKWLRRRAGVSFGFGGKLLRFGIADGKSKVSISAFEVDSDIGTASEEFAKTLEQGDLAAICESKIAKASTDEEKADWKVIETLISDSPRNHLIEYLGFSGAEDDEVVEEKKEPGKTDGAEEEGASFFDQSNEGGNFLSDLASSKGAKTNNPFSIYSGSESNADKKITQALMQGSFETAVDIALKENRLSDAFMIAICGGDKCIAKARAAYFKKQIDGPNYTRLLASIVGNNLWDVVYNADLKDWKEVMVTLCTYADKNEFPDLCEALGDRLEEAIAGETESYRKDASFCYLAGAKLEKVVVNWAQELQENEAASVENSTGDNSFSIHAKSLQDFIEKVTVFRQVTKFQDTEQQKEEGWKLGPLYAKYVEYADIASAHGKLSIAERYLDLLPEKYPAADVARDRIMKATRKATPQIAQRQSQATPVQRGSRVVPTYQAQTPAPAVPVAAPLQQPGSQYAPVNPLSAQAQVAVPSPYTQVAPSRNAYTPAGYQPSAPSIPQPGGFSGYQQPQANPLAPPPRNFSSSPSIGPAATQKNIPNWNDMPENFIAPPKPASRRATPLNAVNSPFQAQQGPHQTFGGPSPTYPPQSRPTPPPPPKGPPQGPPRISSPQTSAATAHSPYAPGPPSNAYTPPSSSFASPQQPPVPRGTSPYNPPPSAAPPSNRYAPAPGSTPSGPPAGMPPPRQVAPPPTQFGGPSPYSPAPSPYAPAPAAQAPPQAAAPPQRGPPQGPPRAGLPPGGPPQAGPPRPDSRPGTASSQRAATAAPKHPAGDRSHIPDASRPIYEILNADMQRVKAKAPANFKAHVADTEKRLNILFDHLNNEDLLKPDTVQEMKELAEHIQARQYDQAIALFTDLMTNKTEEGSNWMVGVKRLIQFSKSTPH
ncbi:protein transport protein S31 [Didymosphaeria variabile]|uniref:Protein transport protein SEC31 n=1 Tax=Didymosphaeria variabile TaxID=1932322 RepID=A0A9W9CD52_9PLEO|nr:protein transport protein S31 [Didymosphaeria variabile]KAJ4356303.1 protein transport protein S31 [Didymosphaeria variabile]